MAKSSRIKIANRKAKKLRINVSAPSGAGKTLGALYVALGITGGDPKKICVVDTERDSASLYAHLGEYSVLNLAAPYSPMRFIEAIKEVENAECFEVLILDSASHEWNGRGGCLEMHTMFGGKFQDWSKVTPKHNEFIDAILNSSLHVITTTRRKEEYVMNTEEGKKVTIEKVGLKEVQRDDYSYEMDLVFDISHNHTAKITKDRTMLFSDDEQFKITEDTGLKLKEWSEKGIKMIDTALASIRNCKTQEALEKIQIKYLNSFKDVEKKDFIAAVKAKEENLALTIKKVENTELDNFIEKITLATSIDDLEDVKNLAMGTFTKGSKDLDSIKNAYKLQKDNLTKNNK